MSASWPYIYIYIYIYNLMKILTHRTLMICSDCKLKMLLEEICDIFLSNDYVEWY